MALLLVASGVAGRSGGPVDTALAVAGLFALPGWIAVYIAVEALVGSPARDAASDGEAGARERR